MKGFGIPIQAPVYYNFCVGFVVIVQLLVHFSSF